jgi:hypothetical protein
MGKLVADLVDQHNIVLMANHGVVAWSPKSVEDAYFKDGDPRGVLPDRPRDGAARQAAKYVHRPQMQDLLKIKQTLDIPDPRIGGRKRTCATTRIGARAQCAVPASPHPVSRQATPRR